VKYTVEVPERPDHPSADCDAKIVSPAEAATMLQTQPACLDKAIAALEAFSENSANAMSDLGAAYYVRAQRRNRPTDLLFAFDATEHAVNAKPQPQQAAFNLRFIEQALGLGTFPQEWSPAKLDAALRHGDSSAVSRLVRSYPTSALRFMEDELLPSRIKEARLLANELATITGDRYAIDEVNAATPASSDAYAAFRQAHLFLDTEKNLQLASDGFHRANSPAALYADAVYARDLDALEQEARRRNYRHLTAYILSMRGYRLFYESRFLESLSSYNAALDIFQQIHDLEGVAATRTRIVGILRVTGQYDEAWKMGLDVCRHLSRLPTIKERNLALGETAAAADKLGHPHVAARYAEAVVVLVRQELKATPPENLRVISMLQHQLSIALRRTATYELENDQYSAAQSDLAESLRLAHQDRDPQFRTSLQARIAEIQARLLLKTDRVRAAEQFRVALKLSEGLEYRSFRASLYAQLAAAEKDQRDAAEQDLRNALAELDAEESTLIANRIETDYERLVWRDYFSRFQDTYHSLITLLIETGRAKDAFQYADRARAFEPLNLALQLSPRSLPTVTLSQVQKMLPPGTFLIEYTLLDEGGYVWVITHEEWRVLSLMKAHRKTVTRWSAALPAESTLFAAHDQLLREPLATIAKMPYGAHPRLVIVPDGAMYGIPFAALRASKASAFLIQEAPIEMAGSAALYALSLKRDRELPPDTTALLIGDPSSNLVHAKEEAEQIEKVYAPRATLRIRGQATISEFLRRASDNAIVHVAAHAVVDPQNPSRSIIKFADGNLDAAQLLARSNTGRTRLVVLATCSSAGGVPIGPEGVGPLVRPLIVRGVPAVIGSLWNVDDATAEPLLVSFHQHYRKGSDAAVAMQLAQIELLRNTNSGLQSVLAWAPFQVIGHGTSPFGPRGK